MDSILGTLALFMRHADEVNPGESYYPLLIPFIKSMPVAKEETQINRGRQGRGFQSAVLGTSGVLKGFSEGLQQKE